VHKLTYKKSVKKELDSLPDSEFLKIDEAILSLKQEPFPYPQSKKRKGEDQYRLRVGHYRVVYVVDENRRRLLSIAFDIERKSIGSKWSRARAVWKKWRVLLWNQWHGVGRLGAIGAACFPGYLQRDKRG
jgi:mRNA interferase RelE/StbE